MKKRKKNEEHINIGLIKNRVEHTKYTIPIKYDMTEIETKSWFDIKENNFLKLNDENVEENIEFTKTTFSLDDNNLEFESDKKPVYKVMPSTLNYMAHI